MRNSKEIRTCMGCRVKKNKKDLIRLVNLENNGITIDLEQRVKARGVYICKDENCFKRARKNIARLLKTSLEDEKYNELRGVMFDR